jgi:hypothetical protein
MNNNANDTFANVTSSPLSLFVIATSAISSRFSYVQIPHIKFKAEHQALVLFHIIKTGLAYWRGWLEGKRTDSRNKEKLELKRTRDRNRYRRRRIHDRVASSRKYTFVFQ